MKLFCFFSFSPFSIFPSGTLGLFAHPSYTRGETWRRVRPRLLIDLCLDLSYFLADRVREKQSIPRRLLISLDLRRNSSVKTLLRTNHMCLGNITYEYRNSEPTNQFYECEANILTRFSMKENEKTRGGSFFVFFVLLFGENCVVALLKMAITRGKKQNIKGTTIEVCVLVYYSTKLSKFLLQPRKTSLRKWM